MLFFLDLQEIITYSDDMELKTIITDDVKTLFQIFDNQIRLVGGCVRDYLLGQACQDYDLATPLLPQDVIDRLQRHNIPVFLTGARYGTVTAVYHGTSYEITTLRTDDNQDGRHASVRFVSQYQQDAQRRDFTINALYMDCLGDIQDYTDGLSDLEKKCVRFIGHPIQRVREDFLRVLRYFRFVAYLGTHHIDNVSLQACRDECGGLKNISVERIQAEMKRLLMAPHVIQALALMHQAGVLAVLIPQYHINRLADFIHIYPQADFLQRLSVLTDNPLALNWKWSRSQKKQIQQYLLPVCITMDDIQNKYLLWQLGWGGFLFHVYQAVLNCRLSLCEVQNMYRWTMPVFPVTGYDVYQLGFRGKEIADQLKIAENLWVKIGLPCEKKLVINALLRYNEQKTNNGKDVKNAKM